MPIKPSLAETHPELAKQWYTEKNGDYTIDELTPGSSKKFWWKCDLNSNHQCETTIYNRTKRGQGCPVCAYEKRKPRNPPLSETHPELSKQWHPNKNGSLIPSKPVRTTEKIWWKCPKGNDHSFSTKIINDQIYTTLSTTGGSQNSSNSNVFDQITLISMRDRPYTTHLKLNEILNY